MKSRASVLVPVVIFAIVAAAMAALPARGQSESSVALMAVDVNTQGNGLTTFGPVDGCIRVEPGAEFDVDVGVDAVPADRPMIAFEFRVGYDPALVEVISSDNAFLLSAVGVFEPFVGVQDPFPDKDGEFVASVLDIASGNPNPGDNSETGPGVLVRMRLRALAPGQVTIVPTFTENDVPLVLDSAAAPVPITRLQGGIVAIGQDCPAGPAGPGTTPPPVDGGAPDYTDPDNPGTPTPPPGATPGSGETPDPNATPGPDDTPAPDGSATPTGSPGASRSPSPTPDGGTTVDEEGDDDGTSNAVIIIGALLLAVAGIAAAGAGAWFILRMRGGGGGPPSAPPPAPGDGGTPSGGPGANI